MLAMRGDAVPRRRRKVERVVSCALACVLWACVDTDNTGLPPGIPCTPTATPGVDPAAGVAFTAERMLCVSIDTKAEDWQRLRQEHRFGSGQAEAFDALGDLIAAGCVQSYPEGFNEYRANIAIDGVALTNVSVRKKGFLGSVIGAGMHKPSLKLDTDTFVKGQKLGVTERITLNNNAQDPTRLQTCMAYEVFALAGYPAPRCNLANVMVNHVARGTYSHVEAVKKPLLKRAFGNSTGSLYEGTLADFTAGHLAARLDGELGRWQPKTDATDPKGAPLQKVLDALQVSDSELDHALGGALDLPRFFTFWALETLTGHTDGYTTNRNNFYVYFDPDNGGLGTLIPWGTDNVLNDDNGDDPDALARHTFAELPRRLSRVPSLAARYLAELRRLLDDVWREDVLLARIDGLQAQVATAENNPEHASAVAALRTWIKGRRARVMLMIAAGLPAGRDEPRSCSDLNGVQDGAFVEILGLATMGL